MADDASYFWHLIDTGHLEFISYLDDHEVRVCYGLGMVQVRGRLLKVNLRKVSEYIGLLEFERRVSRACGWAMRRVMPVAYLEGTWATDWDWDCSCLGSRVGSYVLFFGSAWQNRTPIFSNNMMLDKWGPRLRTYDGWLVYLQRRVKAWLNAKKSLALAMGLHARLGSFSRISALGEDLAAKVCALL